MAQIVFKKNKWYQIGGDMNPSQYGAIIGKYNADGSVELIEIQPVREHVGDGEALEVGHPFWSKEAYFDPDDLELHARDVSQAFSTIGLEPEDLPVEVIPRAFAIAEALLRYGRGEESNAGWAKDVLGSLRVQWWGEAKPKGYTYLADEDREFKQLQKEAAKAERRRR